MEHLPPGRHVQPQNRSQVTGKYQIVPRVDSEDLSPESPVARRVGPDGHGAARPCFSHAEIRKREREMKPVFGRKQSWFEHTFRPRSLPTPGSTCSHLLLAHNDADQIECVDCGAVHLMVRPKGKP